MERHLPGPFQDNALFNDFLHDKRMELLMFLKCKVLGENAAVSDILRWVSDQRALSPNTFVPDTDLKWIERTCKHQRWERPRFSLVPVNCKALLFHWRVLLLLLDHLSEEEHQQFKQGIKSDRNECSDKDCRQSGVVDRVGFEDNSSEANLPDNLEAFDSHFYADQLGRALFGNPPGSL